MQLLTVLPDALTLVVPLTDEAPKDEDVKAGWVAFVIFIGLILAVAFLGFSLVKQLRKAEAAEEAGLYDPSDRKRPARMEIPQEQPADTPEPPTS
ncbi:MAG TPA: hypothetical protein VGE43_07820 [Acidimicrobiales bacterium]